MLENKFLLRVKNILLRRAPGLLIVGNRVAAKTFFFADERKYLRGALASGCEAKSVILFTSVRCGSQYMSRVIAMLYEEMGGKFINLPNYFFHADPKRAKDLRKAEAAVDLMTEQGFFFGAHSTFAGDFPFEDYTKILCVRDPRDVLVSGFYSLAHAHSPSDKKFARDSAEAREKGLEWFVRQPVRYGMIKDHYAYFRDQLLPREDTLFFQYEEMMDNFPSILSRISEHIGHDPSGSKAMRELESEHAEKNRPGDSGEGSSGGEEQLRHRRSGKAGQYKKKLTQEAQDFLTETFADDLCAFGYATD